MARSINKVILLGNVTRNPVLRIAKSGKPMCDFGIATNRAYTDDKGQRHEQAQFHTIVAWGKLAEITGKYPHKGSRVYVEGRLQIREYETADGQKKSRTEVVINELGMLDAKATHDAPGEQKAANGNATDDTVRPDSLPDTSFLEADINSQDIPY